MKRTLTLLIGLLLAPLAATRAAERDSATTKLDITYKTTEQGPLRLDLHYPETPKPDARYPLVIFTHGGGWSAGNKTIGSQGVRSMGVNALTAEGFAVASVDYRLCTADGKVTIKDCVTDSKDALRYLATNAKRLSLDANHVFTFGDSAGGQIAQMLLLSPPASLPGDPALADATYRMIAGVSWYGPCDFEKTELFNPTGQPGFRDRFGPRILHRDADPKAKLAAYREVSPVNYLKPGSPPLLMIQGDKDTTIPVHHARYMKERADAVKAPVEILIVENAGHNWREIGGPLRPTLHEIVKKTAAFLKQHLELGWKKALPVALRAAPSAGTDKLPAFSWEHVPRYVHVRKDTSFTDDEIRYLASFPLVTLEKGTGAKEFGSTEAGTLAAARAVKAVNPGTKVLYYRNVIVHYGGYAANVSLTGLPGALLVGRDGSDKLVRNRVQAYDLSNAKLRDWWLSSAKRVCADPAIDGLFFDGNVKVLEPAYLRDEIGEKKKAALVDGYTAMVQDARRVLGPQKLMVANVLRARFPDSGMSRLRAFDGSYMEAFEATVANIPRKDYVAKGIAAFQEAARHGFLIAFTAGLGGEENEERGTNQQRTDEMRKSLTQTAATTRRFQYLLAVFLICAEKHSYFYAHDGYDAKKGRVWMTRAPELERPLGAPKGPAIRAGYVYTRDFAHASVRLDIENETAVIQWKAI